MAMQAQQIQDQGRVEVRTRFGTLPIDQENLLNLPEGLPGFEDLHRFALFHDEGNHSIFYLQSVEDASVRLPLTNPQWFNVEYQITLSDEEAALLEMESPEDLAVLVTVTDDNTEAQGLHANFSGPIIINTRKRTALQKTLQETHGSLVIRSH